MQSVGTSEILGLSFFSGAMGLDLGLLQAGIPIVLVSEIDKNCRETISVNHPNIALIGDIRDYSEDKIKEAAGINGQEIDLIAGGPPCQAFSTAGRRQGFVDERGNAFLVFIDRVLGIKPKYAVMENVRGLLSAPLAPGGEKGGALRYIMNKLENAGYGVSFNLYNSANFGTPQKRERVIIVCSRDGNKPPYLEPTHSETGMYGLPIWRTFRQAVEGLEENNMTYINFPEKRLTYYKMLGAGENWRALPVSLQKEALGGAFYAKGGKTGFLRRLAWDKPAPTLVTHPAMPATDLAHPVQNRPLSVQEYMRIQEFPDNYKICGNILNQYKQIGNAVPVSLGVAVGRLIQKLIFGLDVKSYDNFPYSRYKNTDENSF